MRVMFCDHVVDNPEFKQIIAKVYLDDGSERFFTFGDRVDKERLIRARVIHSLLRYRKPTTKNQ